MHFMCYHHRVKRNSCGLRLLGLSRLGPYIPKTHRQMECIHQKISSEPPELEQFGYVAAKSATAYSKQTVELGSQAGLAMHMHINEIYAMFSVTRLFVQSFSTMHHTVCYLLLLCHRIEKENQQTVSFLP